MISNILITAIPKSGLHLAEQMVACLYRPARIVKGGWVGVLSWRGWSLLPDPSGYQQAKSIFDYLESRHGGYVKGHIPYLAFPDLADTLGVVYVRRHIDDVAESIVRHILSDDPRLLHPGREAFRALGGHDRILKAVWEGLPPYPPLDKWLAAFEGWSGDSRVLTLDYGTLLDYPAIAVEQFLAYTSRGAITDALVRALQRRGGPTYLES